MKKYLLLLVALLSVFVLGACNRNQIDSDFELITEEQLREQTSVINIKFRVPSGVIATALEDLIPVFEEQWEGKIVVELEKISDGYDGVLTQNVYDLNNKTAPSLTLAYPDHMALYYSGEGLISLSPYIEEENIDLSDFVQSYLPENQIADENSEYYGLPMNKSTEVLIYNKTVFDAMGYTVPVTWADVETLSKQMIEDCREGKLDSLIPIASGEKKPSEYLAEGVFYPIAYDSTDNAFITMCRQWGGAYTERNNVSSGYALFNNDQVKTGLGFFQRLANEKVFAVAETFDESYASNAFKALKCLMTIGSSAGVGYNLPTADKFALGVSTIPYLNAENKYVIQQGTNICILSQNTNLQRAASWQLIKFLTSPENTVEFCLAGSTGGYLPVRNSAYDNAEYKAFLAGATNFEALNYHFAAAASVGLSYRQNNFQMFVDPGFVGSSTIREQVGFLFSKVVVKSEDIQRTITDTLNTLGPKYQKN